MKCDKKMLQKDIREKLGKHVTLKDLTNLKAKLKGANESNLTEAINFLEKEKNADVSIFTNGNEFKALYFSTPEMRKSLAAWPEIVCVDGTYCLLDSNLTVMLMLVEDSNAGSEIVAVGLFATETEETMNWFFQTFKRNNGESCVAKIRCWMSDKDMVGRRVLKKLFPGIPIYICLFHTLQAFRRAMSKDKMDVKKEIKDTILELLQKLAYSASEEEYQRLYTEFCTVAPTTVKDYYNLNWHQITEDWTAFGMTKGNLNNRTNNRMESLNQKIKQVVAKRSTLMVFLKSFFTFLESHMSEIDSRAAGSFMKRKSHKKNTDEDRASVILTDAAFQYVSSELERCDSVTFTAHSQSEYKIITKSKEIRISTTGCSCGAPSSTLLPCRHIFAVRKLCGLKLFDESLCHQRWTKNYYQLHQRIFRCGEMEPIGERLPLICNEAISDVSLVDTRKMLVKPVIESLQFIVSNSCRSTFLQRYNILRILEHSWKNGLDVDVAQKEIWKSSKMFFII